MKKSFIKKICLLTAVLMFITSVFAVPAAKAETNNKIVVDFEKATSIYTTDSENFVLTTEPGNESNKVICYKGASDANQNNAAQNRVALTWTDVNTKKITDFVNPGEEFVVKFKYKYLSADAPNANVNFQTTDSANLWAGTYDKLTDYVSKTLVNPKNGSWQSVSVTLKIKADAVNYNHLSALVDSSADIYFDEAVVYKPTNISFNTNGGTAVDTVKCEPGEAVELPAAPKKQGAAFKGWYTDAELTAPFNGIAPETDTTLYAGWISGYVYGYEDNDVILLACDTKNGSIEITDAKASE